MNKKKVIATILIIIAVGLLVAGGIAYSLGAILYGLGKKHKWMHSIFHLFILSGSLLQFLCILIYVM